MSAHDPKVTLRQLQDAATRAHPGAKRRVGTICEAGWSALGDRALLRDDKVGLFCSVHCPGARILRAYDYAKELQDDRVTVMGADRSR